MWSKIAARARKLVFSSPPSSGLLYFSRLDLNATGIFTRADFESSQGSVISSRKLIPSRVILTKMLFFTKLGLFLGPASLRAASPHVLGAGGGTVGGPAACDDRPVEVWPVERTHRARADDSRGPSSFTLLLELEIP